MSAAESPFYDSMLSEIPPGPELAEMIRVILEATKPKFAVIGFLAYRYLKSREVTEEVYFITPDSPRPPERPDTFWGVPVFTNYTIGGWDIFAYSNSSFPDGPHNVLILHEKFKNSTSRT